ncbi:spindle and kinetochore-associated protein 1 [Arapaima gigas]
MLFASTSDRFIHRKNINIMACSELEDLVQHINDKISSTRRILELRTIAKDLDKRKMLLKIGQDIATTSGLLDQLEFLIERQKNSLSCLKDLEEFFLEDLRHGRHLRDNPPPHMPRKGHSTTNSVAPSQGGSTEAPMTQDNLPKKAQRNLIREMEYITTQEFDSIPQYMKGRVTYSQLNAVVQSINTAVKGKYSILQQPAKALSSTARKLYQRFKEEETKDTKGQFFVVEEDLREFTQLKIDKRFQSMLSMLRHCQRLRELRGGGLTRYILL